MKQRCFVQFNSHYNLKDRHSFLSPSNYHWIRYTDEKLEERIITAEAAARGIKLHKLAHDLISLGVKLPHTKKSFNLYVNDSIGYRMSPELILYYSDNCFGTADALGFRRNTVRIFDLKTGESKASVDQLLVYDALFCLEYHFKPFEIEHDLRIYQSDEVQVFEVDPSDVAHIMDRIITFSKRIDEVRLEEPL
jgi:hypothetical protein